jgi:hypothetical protein
MYQNFFRLFPIVTLFVTSVFGTFAIATSSLGYSFIPTVFAEDDENEYENENEHQTTTPSSSTSSSSSSSSSKVVMKKVVQEVVEYKPVSHTSIVTDEEYLKDTDGDGLVDAIDPDPSVDQRKYFTDSDDDGVPDILDQHPDEDDFLYYESEADENNNGILDSYEETVSEPQP